MLEKLAGNVSAPVVAVAVAGVTLAWLLFQNRRSSNRQFRV